MKDRTKIPQAKSFLAGVACSICFAGIGVDLSAQETAADLSNPTNRFIRQNPEKDVLSHWRDDIALELVGPGVDQNFFRASAFAKMLADNAGVQLR
ncbi:hypothetical protein [Leisingera methylohalidivorans]|uniref:hypothetical protein n=1 Tax=Leisingera methylohalidivorans TaxID=133924 RepID=UPI0012EBB8AA|nr:hypothetical protein [Leisingera methylohalidivorans]